MTPTEKALRQIVRERIRKVFSKSKRTTRWNEVKYFHPEGKSMPNGVYYQRGGFIHECRKNAENFVIDESVHDRLYGLSKYRGGVIVFSTDLNAVVLDRNRLLNKINEKGGEHIGAYSVGNFFKG